MARQYAGAATFEFRRDGEAWAVEGHFFDDIGRSGQIELRQVLTNAGSHTDRLASIAKTKLSSGKRAGAG